MKQDRLNKHSCLQMHCHKSIRDTLDTVLVPTKNTKGVLKNLSRGMRMAEWKMSSPHVSKRFAASEERV